MITEVMDAVIETQSGAGSVFATTTKGEGVFINSRIVAVLGLQPMEQVRVFALPNYPEKQDRVPWRAVRVERLGEPGEGSEALEHLILEFLSHGGYYTNAEIAEEIGTDPAQVGRSTARLFVTARIAKADVYAMPGQGRPAFVFYAKNVDQFDSPE